MIADKFCALVDEEIRSFLVKNGKKWFDWKGFARWKVSLFWMQNLFVCFYLFIFNVPYFLSNQTVRNSRRDV